MEKDAVGYIHEKETLIKYWKSLQLQDVNKTVINNDSIVGNHYKQEKLCIQIQDGLVSKLISITKQNDLLLYVIFLTALNIELYKYTTHEERIIGVPMYTSDNKKKFVFKNRVLPFKSKSGGNITAKKLLTETQQRLLDTYENQYLDLTSTLKNLEVCESIMDLTPITLAMSNLHSDIDIEYLRNSSKNEINICLNRKENDELEIEFVYNENLFTKETINLFIERYFYIINEMLNNIDKEINDLNMISKEQENQLIYGFNNTKVDYVNSDKTIYELFELQVEQTPDKVAVIFEDKELTYKEMNEKANAFARHLRNMGIQPENIVGVMLERSMEMVIVIMGILKSGGAYLPIDPMNPKDRIEFMLKDAGVHILLSSNQLMNKINFGGTVIDINDQSIFQGDTNNLNVVNQSNHLAYVIYTSGTTGNPKGVMVEHRSLTKTMLWERSEYNYKENDIVLPIVNYAFDGFIIAFYTPIISGSKVILVTNEEMTNTYKIGQCIKRYGVTDYISVPSIYLTLFEHLSSEDLQCLKVVTLVGEEMPVKVIEYTQGLNSNIEIVNRYGPSENTVDTTIMREVQNSKRILIGKPISNSKVFILDTNNQVVPIGVPGELCIGGERLARGYLNLPELTKEKFIESPFEPEGRLYKTGDLAKWLPDGTIEFLGRIDNQIKIRGLRIELREIESRLLGHPDIKEAVVLVKENNQRDKSLVAYIVGTQTLDSFQLREYVKESLPHYMVPSYFIQLEKMPLTHNGKLDRKALPEPDLNQLRTSVYVAPRNDVEVILVDLWSEVLGVEQIGIHDNFFDLGGHSLKATILVSKIHRQLNVELPLKVLFMHPTISQISPYLEKSCINPYEQIEPCKKQNFYETSSAQKRMYMIQQLENGTVYNMPMMAEIEGSLDVERMEKAFKALINRHDSLRTYFENINGNIVQKIDMDYEWKIGRSIYIHQDVETLPQEFVRVFDLGKAPLFRVELVENHDKTYLLVDMHHIISDGVSMHILLQEFMDLYQGKKLEPLRIQYKDFAVWQNKFIQSEELVKQETYWMQQLGDDLPILNLPYDYERPRIQSFEGNKVNFSISEEMTQQLRNIARETGSTLHMVLLSAFHILLSKYSGQEDIVIGVPVAGRPHADLEKMIGMFVNTLAFRNKAEGDKSYLTFLQEVKENALCAYENQSYQFEELIDKLQLERDTSRNPLFDVMFNMSHVQEEKDHPSHDWALHVIQSESRISKFDLTLHVTEHENNLQCGLEYCTRLFKPETMDRMGQHYQTIIESICTNRESKLLEMNLLTVVEKKQILQDFNDTKTDYPYDKTIQELFEQQVEKRPDHVAVVFKDQKMTYRELNEKANQLARVLRNQGVQSDSVVGIMVGRSVEMIVGILGILKAGGAYLPIDGDYPMNRITYMLEDSNSYVLLTSGDVNKLIDFQGKVIDIANKDLYSGDSSNISKVNTARDLAYIMYSSGSTGEPKGILVEHRNVVRLVKNTNYIQFQQDDIILQTGSLVFDATTFEIWGAMLNGLSLCLINQEKILLAEELETELVSNQVSIMWLTVALFNQLAQEKPEVFRTLRYLLVGGDTLSTKHINLVRNKCPKLNIINGYGPTENTTFTTTFLIDQDYSSSIPIGKPINNSHVYIVDKHGKLQPKGIYGELYIGGDGVARGYLNKTELTVEKFVQDPFVPGERMYKSGDIARWLDDGNIEFLGRADSQIKIRGFRIELEEIERKLLSHPSVKEAVVITKEKDQQEKFLCAYVTVENTWDKVEIKRYLQEGLPNYMVPSYIKEINQMPLTANGKIDKKSLPDVLKDDLVQSHYEAPRNQTEQKLVKIWEGILGIDGIGIDDDFFELGGQSLSLIQTVSNIRKILGADIDIHCLYQNPTIKLISNYILKEEYRINYKEDDIQLLNEKKDKNIFAFPPIGGFGLVYSELARLLSSYSFYSFDFIEREDLIKKYVSLIKSVQKEGPYVLFGYSAGGNLAYNVAVELINQGLEVSDIILLDSYTFDNNLHQITADNKVNLYENIILEAQNNQLYKKYLELDYFKEKVINKVKAYSEYLNSLTNENIINTNIHLIEANNNLTEIKGELNDTILPDWSAFTTKKVITYKGFGEHSEMLSDGNLIQNFSVISNILESLKSKILKF